MDFDCSPRDLTFTQGSAPSGDLIFGHGPVMTVLSFDGALAKIAPSVECFEVGDFVHLAIEDSCCVLHQATYEVTGVDLANNCLTLALTCGYPLNALEAFDGLLTKAMDLNGFELVGVVASAHAGDRAVGMNGCIAAGQTQLLVDGEPEAYLGDSITMPDAGLTDAKILSVYKVMGAACSSSKDRLLLNLDTAATTTVDCDSPKPFTLNASQLAAFTFVLNADCGRATYNLDASFSGIESAGGCSGDCVRVGCYEIVLKTSPTSGVRWSSTVARGAALMIPSLIN